MAITSFSSTIIRAEDLLVLSLELRNVDFDAPQPGQPGRVTGVPGSLLIVHFQPQHVAEQAFFQASDNMNQTAEEQQAGQPPLPGGDEIPLAPGQVQSRLAGPSRLVFSIPAGEQFDFTLAGLLDILERLPLEVTPISRYDPALGCNPLDRLLRLLRVPPPPVVSTPLAEQTAIEAPYRLFLSPDHQAQWQHAPQPVTHDGWTELWHTRLGSGRADGDPRLRAVWSPDFNAQALQGHYDPNNPPSIPDPFRTSLDARDRNELVHLTSNYHLGAFFLPDPVQTEQLMLTTLGAWLRVQGDWEPPSFPPGGSLTVEQWRHEATMARDQYVRVVYAGYLLPFGHRASLVKITERKFRFQEDAETPGYVAYLFQRMFILVRQPRRDYSHRQMPFRTVILKTRITPNLADPTSSAIGGLGQEAFWPRVVSDAGIVDFQFHLSGSDWQGRTSEFTMPLIFVSKNVDETPASIAAVIAAYEGLAPTSARRRTPFNGQPVAFAPNTKADDTTLETTSVSFGALAQAQQSPHFWPSMARAEVDVPAVKQLVGNGAPSTIEWETTYLSGMGSAIGNAGQIYARITSNTPLSFGTTEKSGGLVAPDLTISGLSRVLGPTGGPAAQMVGAGGNSPAEFKPQDIFGSGVKLLGGIELWQIVKDLVFYNAATSANKVPQLVTVRDGNVLRTTYTWQLSEAELVDTGLFVPKTGATFMLKATVEKVLDATTPPSMQIDGALTNFSIVLLPALALVQLDFDSVTFTSQGGKKVDVAVQLVGVQFKGILEFVNELSNYLPLDGFNDPPALKIVPPPDPGLDVGFSLGIPTIGVGIMTMQNISLAASFYLPFGAKPMNFRFAFCEREQPFILTVSLFGGGGFFAINIGAAGVTSLEAALEFGASVALNLGVASGEASIMAGFYFQMVGADFSLTGYFRAAGSLSVLGIITVSLEFYLGLTYASKGITPHGGTLWGQAKLTVKIEILFFSASVSITMEREFSGSDPTFRELVSPSAWTQYCAAFADYPAVPGD
jgi:hypothetical protein